MPKKIKPIGKMKKVKHTSGEIIIDSSVWDQANFLIDKKSQEIKPKKSIHKQLETMKNNADKLIDIGEKNKLYSQEVINQMKTDFDQGDYQAVIDLSFACDYINRSSNTNNKEKLINSVFKTHQATSSKRLNRKNRKIPVSRFTGIQIPTEDL